MPRDGCHPGVSLFLGAKLAIGPVYEFIGTIDFTYSQESPTSLLHGDPDLFMSEMPDGKVIWGEVDVGLWCSR